MKKKMLSIFLILCMAIGMMPIFSDVVSATEQEPEEQSYKSMYLGTRGITSPTKVTDAEDESKVHYIPNSYVYFGIYGRLPIKWSVLDAEKANDKKTDGMFMLAEYCFDYSEFDDDGIANEGQTFPNEWQNSNIQKWCESELNFSLREQAEMFGINKIDENESLFEREWGTSSLNQSEKTFILSARETADYIGNYNGAPKLKSYDLNHITTKASWWLRSSVLGESSKAGVVDVEGNVTNVAVDRRGGIRPACNLSTDSVLFSSYAVKLWDEVKSELESAVVEFDEDTWKLTLHDEERDGFAASLDSDSENNKDIGYENWKININYSDAQTGEDEYISVLLCDKDENVLYYGHIAEATAANGTAEVVIPTGLEAGKYQLHVFSQQKNGQNWTDYASAFRTIDLKVNGEKLETPNAIFNANSANSGTLSNVENGMSYSVDGGASWTAISENTAAITGVTADKDVKVKRIGNGTTNEDSDIQTIDITQAEAPSGLAATACTSLAQNDGKIAGVGSHMEYKLSSESEWNKIEGTELTGLKNGTYQFRVYGNGNCLASPVTEVTVGAHICMPQGTWQSDDDNHWQLCTCGDKINEAAHDFGWIIDKEATEKENGSKHEKCKVCGYEKAAIEIPAVENDNQKPQTGDNSNIILWVALILVSFGGFIGITAYNKMKKQ